MFKWVLNKTNLNKSIESLSTSVKGTKAFYKRLRLLMHTKTIRPNKYL